MERVFEQANRRRRQHEFTLTSTNTNCVYYGSPAWAKPRDIWPPLSSEIDVEIDASFTPKLLDQLFKVLETPLGSEFLDTSPAQWMNPYEPLHEGRIIRLAELWPGKRDDELTLDFHCADLQTEYPPYEALSYVWGEIPSVDARRPEVRVNGHRLCIPANLERALRTLRYTEKSRLIWADSVCINQLDSRERGHQVSLMSDVYRNARRVVVWLGDIANFGNESHLADYEHARAEHGFGAVCEVINHWLGAKSSARKACYRIIENERYPEDLAGSAVFEHFEMESTTVKTSETIKRCFSTPIKEHDITLDHQVSRGLAVYLRRGFGTYEPIIQYNANGTVSQVEEPSDDPGLRATPQSAPSSAFWQALNTLFSSTWFWRLWVFQEVALACSAVVRWGHCEMDWRYVGLAAAILRTNNGAVCEGMKMRGLYNAYLMFRVSRTSDLPPVKLDFLRLLQLTRQFDVTDSRDRVFGLLGMRLDDNNPESGDLFLKPDYAIDVKELWRRVAFKAITHTKKLSLLSSVQYTTETFESENALSPSEFRATTSQIGVEIPSWIPQWDFVFRATLSPWDTEEKFSASRGLSSVDMTVVEGVLFVRGVRIGKVIHTLSFMWHDIDLSLLWSPHLQDNFKTEEGLRLLAITLTAGRNRYGSIVRNSDATVADLAAYILSLDEQKGKDHDRGLDDGGHMSRHARDVERDGAPGPLPQLLHRLAAGGSAVRFLETATAYCERRRLFITANGFLGLGADTVSEGDELAVLAGGDLPYVLRPTPQRWKPVRETATPGPAQAANQPSSYLLIGESYVSGLMDGQIGDAVEKRMELKGPLESVLVKREVLEKAMQPTIGFVAYGDDQQNEQLNKSIRAKGMELLNLEVNSAEIKEFEIR